MSRTLDDLGGLEKEGAQAAVEEWISDLVVLSFRENRRGGDPIAHTGDGRAVFPDKFQGGDDVRAGEHWICSLSQKGESTFFAAPVVRVDGGFVESLSRDQLGRLARVIAEDYQEALPDLGGEDGETPAVVETNGLVQERDELQKRLTELNDQYDDALSRLAQAEGRLQAYLEEAQTDDARGDDDGADEEAPRKERYAVTRDGEDVLLCDAFEDGGYHGHVSPSLRTVFLKAYGRGPYRCKDGRIIVPGLGMVIPEGVRELEARFDPRHGGFFLEIPAS